VSVPAVGTSDKVRARHKARLEHVRKQNEWGDLDDAPHRRLRAEVDAALAALPTEESDRLALIEKTAVEVASLGDVLAGAEPDSITALVALLVERVDVQDREVIRVKLADAARPSFTDAEWSPAGAVLARPEGCERARTTIMIERVDVLAEALRAA
jgi:hypothetical protein